MIGGRVRPEQRPELLAGGRRQGVSGEKYFWPSSKHATSGTLMQVPDLGSRTLTLTPKADSNRTSLVVWFVPRHSE